MLSHRASIPPASASPAPVVSNAVYFVSAGTWTFGATYTTANGAQANMKLGGKDYLIQRNWVNALGGYCALSY